MTDNEQELQQKYMQFQVLQQQMTQLQQYLQSIETDMQKVAIMKQGLSDLEKTKKGTKILASLNPGMFTHATLENNDEIIINVGANIAVKKSLKEAKDIVNNQEKQLGEIHGNYAKDLDNITKQFLDIQKEIQNV